MRRLLWLLALIGIFTLAACGGSDGDDENTNESTATDTTTQNDSTTSTDNAGFTATISGATDATVSGAGYFQCDDVGEGELTIGAGFSMTNNILIMFPAGTSAGTYDLTSDNSLNGDYNAMYIGDDILTANYEENISGTLTLDEVATATGEPVRGSFAFEASTNEGATVNVSGNFDFTAGNNAYFNCTE